MKNIILQHKPPLYTGYLPNYHKINSQIFKGFMREKDGSFSQHSHYEMNRYENIYIKE